MSFFGKPSGAEPRITYERIDLSAEAAMNAFDEGPRPGQPERTEPRVERRRAGAPEPGIMLVSADSVLDGCLTSRGTVRVEGVLRGELRAPVLLLEPGGLVEGQVHVERLRLAGTLRGVVEAREIEVVRTAQVDAELSYDEISVERGARVRGMHRQREMTPPSLAEPPMAAASLAAFPAEAAPQATAAAPIPDPTTTPAPTPALAPAPAVPEAGPGALRVRLVEGPSEAEAAVLAAAAASTAALVAEAEAALQELAAAAHAAAGAAEELASEGVDDLMALEGELRRAPEHLGLDLGLESGPAPRPQD